MSISGKQVAMARILLDLSQKDLADKLGIARKTIIRIESGQTPGSAKTSQTIQSFFESKGLEFLENDGIKRQSNPIKKLKGKAGMYELMNDILKYTQNGGQQISLFNARPVNWLNWVDQEWFYNTYSKSLAAIKNLDMRIIAVEGETSLISKGHAENRFLPSNQFINENKSFYVYDNKTALINFEHEELEILIIENQDFANSVNLLFTIAWENITIKPPQQKEGSS